MKLRLLVTKRCERSCKGCCNNEWDLDNLPLVDRWGKYDEILITGGEPLLFPEKLDSFMQSLTAINPIAKYYIYTAKPEVFIDYPWIMKFFDGFTITLHEPSDWIELVMFDNLLHVTKEINPFTKSIRINHFRTASWNPSGPNLEIDFNLYDFRWDKEWLTDCPLPDGEELRRIVRLW